MEEINKSFDREDLIEKLKNNDPKAEALMRDFKQSLQREYMSDTMSVYREIAKAYEEGGLLEKAKNAYYTARTYAEKSNDFVLVDELMEKVRSLPGNID